ncbi:MAG: S-layer homology domain-containing protein, partial [Ruminococcaceae bacterium]|nr:S-layer homology domain-containing protein [Oscillospiraceae bacterium]
MKKIISVILLSVMLLGIVPIGTIAEDSVLPFEDVKASDWFYNAVVYSYENGIFKGTNTEGTEFSPLRKMTRAEFATTLFRASGANEEAYSGNTGFSDVPAGKWMSAAVKWAAEMGYVKGTGGNKFNPNGTLDR